MNLINRKDMERGKCYLSYRHLDGVYSHICIYELDGLFTNPPTYKCMVVYGDGDARVSTDYDLTIGEDNLYLYELDEDEAFRAYHMIKIIEAL